MKILVLAFLIGFAAAKQINVLDKLQDEAVLGFVEGMGRARSLREAMNMPFAEELDEVEDDIKTELRKTFKDILDKILDYYKDHDLQLTKETKEILIKQAKQIVERLKELRIDTGNEVKEKLLEIKEEAGELIRRLLEKLGLAKRSLDNDDDAHKSVSAFVIRTVLRKIYELLISKFDDIATQKIESYIDDKLGNDSQIGKILKKALHISKTVLKKVVANLLGLYGYYYGEVSTRDLHDGHLNDSQVRAFFEWLKETFDAGIEVVEDKIAFVKDIAQMYISHAKEVTKEVAKEVVELFRPYKDDLGKLWDDLVETAKQARDY